MTGSGQSAAIEGKKGTPHRSQLPGVVTRGEGRESHGGCGSAFSGRDNIHKKGTVGRGSREAPTLHTKVWQLTCRGVGQSTLTGNRRRPRSMEKRLIWMSSGCSIAIRNQKGIIMIGEMAVRREGGPPNGSEEIAKSRWGAWGLNRRESKTAPPGRRMGTRGGAANPSAGGKGTAAAKIEAFARRGSVSRRQTVGDADTLVGKMM